MHRAARALGFQIPEGAVERIAGGARRHCALQRAAVEPCGKPVPHPLDARRRRRRRFRHSAHRARIRRGRARRPSESSATTTRASVLAPRLMAKEPAIGQLSAVTERVSGTGKELGISIGTGLSPNPRQVHRLGSSMALAPAPTPRGRALKSEACRDERPLARSQCQRRPTPARRRRRLDRQQRTPSGKPDQRGHPPARRHQARRYRHGARRPARYLRRLAAGAADAQLSPRAAAPRKSPG